MNLGERSKEPAYISWWWWWFFPWNSCCVQNKGWLKSRLLLSDFLRNKNEGFFSLSSSSTPYALFFWLFQFSPSFIPSVESSQTRWGLGKGIYRQPYPYTTILQGGWFEPKNPRPQVERLYHYTWPALPSHSFIIKKNEPITLAFIVFRRKKRKYLK